MVFNMQENIKRYMGWEDNPQVKLIQKSNEDIEKSFDVISQFYLQGQISSEIYESAKNLYNIEKGKKEITDNTYTKWL
jgi:hypothetical protein